MADPIRLELPQNAIVVGALMAVLADNDDEDVLQVMLPNGLGIDVGNYCHGVAPLFLRIVAFRNGNFHDQLETWETADPHEAARIVERWCVQNA